MLTAVAEVLRARAQRRGRTAPMCVCLSWREKENDKLMRGVYMPIGHSGFHLRWCVRFGRVTAAECRQKTSVVRCIAFVAALGSSALSLRCSFARRMFDMLIASNVGGDAAAKGVHCTYSVWSCSPKGGGSLSTFFFFFYEGQVVRPHRRILPLRSSRSHVACTFRDWTLCGRRNLPPTLRALLRKVTPMSLTRASASCSRRLVERCIRKIGSNVKMRASMHTFVLENAFSYYTAVQERSLMLFSIH
jgi:hypothetical protein